MAASAKFEADERHYFEVAAVVITAWMVDEGLLFFGSLFGVVIIVAGYVLALAHIRLVEKIKLELLYWLKVFICGGLIFLVLWMFDLNIRTRSGSEVPSLGIALYCVMHIPAYMVVYLYFKWRNQ